MGSNNSCKDSFCGQAFTCSFKAVDNQSGRTGNIRLFVFASVTGPLDIVLLSYTKKACNLPYLEFAAWNLFIKKY